MSFILDALKKSELERQRQAAPGTVESSGARPEARLPVWALALGALLAVNVIVLAVMLLRGGTAAPPTAQAPLTGHAPAVDPASTSGARDRTAGQFSPMDAAPEYAQEIPPVGETGAGLPGAGQPGADSRSRAAPAPTPARSVPRAAAAVGGAARPAQRREPVLTNDDYKPGDESLPTINEVTQSLPDLHLDVHVYSTQPADRFVFINMRKYHEGATLSEGPTIERIRRDGVVMNYQGLRFLLPRQ